MTDIDKPILMVIILLSRSIESLFKSLIPLKTSNRSPPLSSTKSYNLEKIKKKGRERLLFTSKGILQTQIVIITPTSNIENHIQHFKKRNTSIKRQPKIAKK